MQKMLPASAISASQIAPVQERSTSPGLFLRVCILLFPLFAGAISGFGQFGSTTYYRDADSDGFGNPNVSTSSFFPVPGYVTNRTDCNDNSAIEKPGQRWYLDSDNDRYGATGAASVVQCLRPAGYKAGTELIAITGDCNDNDANILLGTFWYPDADGDGFGASGGSIRACTVPSGYVADNTDCNDNSAIEKPGQVWYKDSDNDGHGDAGSESPFPIFPITQCNRPEGYKTAGELIATNSDCNDNDPNIKILLLYQDLDGDGFGNSSVFIESCFTGIVGYSRTSGDCNDNDPNIGLPRLWGPDADGDGFGAAPENPAGPGERSCLPPGYIVYAYDCNDNSALEKPGQVWYKDSDNDGHGDAGSSSPQAIQPIIQCNRPDGYKTAGELISTNGDCNDNDPNITILLLYEDLDGDGFGNSSVFITLCTGNPAGYSRTGGDCNDNDQNVNPNTLWYRDADGDGFGFAAGSSTSGGSIASCTAIEGYVSNADDCNDNSVIEKPGQVWYMDRDNDGYGYDGFGSGAQVGPITSCTRPPGYRTAGELITTTGDCDDTNPGINPATLWYRDADGDGFGVTETAGIPGVRACLKPGGYAGNQTDCNDADPAINPNTVWYRDADGDGFGFWGASSTSGGGVVSCTAIEGYVSNADDCNDNSAIEKPGQVWYMDSDNDGYGYDGNGSGAVVLPVTQCDRPAGYRAASELVATTGDCNDNDALEKPRQVWYKDSDNDRFTDNNVPTIVQCLRPVGYKASSELYSITSDCNDNDPNEKPFQVWFKDLDNDGASDYFADPIYQCSRPAGYKSLGEIGSGGIRKDCFDDDPLISKKTVWYRDEDGDGFGNPLSKVEECFQPVGYVANDDDCNDYNSNIKPGTIWFYDVDLDGYGDGSSIIGCDQMNNRLFLAEWLNSTTGDCNDNNAAINPRATEICNGKDDNCNGLVDDGLVSCIPPVVTAPTLTQPTCVLQTGRIIVRATGPATLQYSINNGASFSNIANFTNLAPGNYFIVVRSTSNPNYPVPYAGNPVVINPVPPLAAPTTIAGPVGVCRNTTEVFSVAPVVGAVSYQWTLPFNASGTSTTNSISVTFNNNFSSGNISVRAINTCGQSPLFTRNIEYYGAKPTQPAAITGQTVGLCGTRTYSIASIAKTNNYIWVNPAGTSIISGQGTTSIVLSFGNSFKSGTLSVAAANCKGTSNARTLVLNRNPEVPASITGPIIGVCENSTQAYSCNLVTGATLYTWVVPAGAVINSGQGTNAISVTFPAGFVSGDIKVASGTACGSGTQRILNVISIPKIPATISGPASVCPNATGIVFSTNAVAGVTYNWEVPSGATITSGQGTYSIYVNWGNAAGQVKVTGSNLCGTSGLRNLAVSLLACGAPVITMAKAEEMKQVSDKLSVQLWPNPARDVLMVRLDEFVPNQKMELTLMQADGKVQQAQSLTPTIKGQQVRMDVSRASAGYYILLIKQTGLSINKQVLIVR